MTHRAPSVGASRTSGAPIHVLTPLLAPFARWGERTQQAACRNAMVSATALAQARLERDDVERYVAGALARREPALPPQIQPAAAPVPRAVVVSAHG